MKAKVGRGKGFRGLLRYVLDEGPQATGEKQPKIIAGNMIGTTAADLTREFGAVRQLRDGIRKPVWHCALSLPPGEHADAGTWRQIVDEHMRTMGLGGHQYVAVRHHDTGHEHVHIVANRVGFEANVWHGKFEAKRAIESTQALEKHFGLTVTPGLEAGAQRALTGNEIDRYRRTGDVPIKKRLQTAIDNAIALSDDFRSFVAALDDADVQLLPSGKTGRVRGAAWSIDGIAMKGSALGRAYAWRRIAERAHFDPERDADLIGALRLRAQEARRCIDAKQRADAIRAALHGLTSTASVFDGATLREALQEAIGDDFEAYARVLIERGAVVVVGDEAHGQPVYSTPAVIEREAQMLRDLSGLAADSRHNLDPGTVQAAIDAQERTTGATLTNEQRRAVAHGCMAGGFVVVQGSAGAGKTFSLQAVKTAHEAQGYELIGACVAKRAAKNLQAETGIDSFTVAKLLKDLNEGRRALTPASVVVIDEAGLLSSGQFASLARHVRQAGAKIVATGEDRQLDAITHGGVLRYVSRPDVIGTARIEQIQRQREAWARQMVMDFRDGYAEAALSALEQRGLVQWRADRDSVHDALIADWHAYEQANPGQSSLLIAHSNRAVRSLSRRVRAIRRDEGRVVGPDHTLTCVHNDKSFRLELARGDRIKFGRNDNRLGVYNGLLGTIESIAPAGDDLRLTVKTDDNARVTINASDYADDQGRAFLSHAYAMTVYSSQGVTVNGDVFVDQSVLMDRANTYVAASRAKDDTRLYVARDEQAARARSDDPERQRAALVRGMSRDRHKFLAAEYLHESRPEWLREVLTNGPSQRHTAESGPPDHATQRRTDSEYRETEKRENTERGRHGAALGAVGPSASEPGQPGRRQSAEADRGAVRRNEGDQTVAGGEHRRYQSGAKAGSARDSGVAAGRGRDEATAPRELVADDGRRTGRGVERSGADRRIRDLASKLERSGLPSQTVQPDIHEVSTHDDGTTSHVQPSTGQSRPAEITPIEQQRRMALIERGELPPTPNQPFIKTALSEYVRYAHSVFQNVGLSGSDIDRHAVGMLNADGWSRDEIERAIADGSPLSVIDDKHVAHMTAELPENTLKPAARQGPASDGYDHEPPAPEM